MMPCPPPHSAPQPARFVPPPGSCDCHMHVFGPQHLYPYVEPRGYTPPDCLLPAYAHLQRTLGLSRTVVVQPSVYGTDNRCTLDAVTTAPEAMRAVAVVSPEAPDAELQRLHARGVRGVRFNVLSGGGLPLEAMEAMARRMAPLGWHLQVFIDLETIAALEQRLAALAVPVVIDHMGHVQAGTPLDDPGFRAMLRLVERGAWVKLSAPYRLSRRLPPYADVGDYARALIAANPETMVWGTDWPHPHYLEHPMPNDGALLDVLDDWAPDAATRDAILAANPARLYDFPPPG